MTYKECLEYLFSQLPIYQRIGQAAYKADLNNTIELLKRLGNPERKFRSIHIAGTNAKGSVSHMLASILQESGMKTGLYTSPHMKDFRERIKVNGEMIAEKEVVEFVEKHRCLVEDIRPSFFEWSVALAFDYFARMELDIVVLETGMGGRLDSTNVVLPELSIITNIGFDHMTFLGNTLEAIAGEKAGIIKKGVPVVVGEYKTETRRVFEEKAAALGAPIYFAQDAWMEPFDCDLKGPYQKINQQTVLHAVGVLRSKGFKIDELALARGLSHVTANTGLRGRWEWIGQEPDILLDMAHNKDGVSFIMKEIIRLEFKKLHIVWGMVSDKDIDEILKLLPTSARYYYCRPDIPRGLDAEVLAEKGNAMHLKGEAWSNVREALQAAKSAAGMGDLIFVGGSTFVVAEALP